MKRSIDVLIDVRAARLGRAFRHEDAGHDAAAHRAFDAANRIDRVVVARLNEAGAVAHIVDVATGKALLLSRSAT